MTIDQELQAALDVEPSPEFVARVRTRLASEPSPANGWRAWWLIPAAALAAAAVSFALFVSRPVPVAPMLVSRALPAIAAPSVAPSVLTPEASAEPMKTRDVARLSSVRVHAETLIDPTEARALRRLVFGRPLNLERPYAGPTLAALEIAPISIEPLPIGSEGVRQ